MKKFKDELNNELVSIGQNIITKEYAYGKDALINCFEYWVSPEDHQAEIGKIELQNLKYREEIARMQKSLCKKNKAIKELNGAVKKIKARLKESEDLRIEANNEAAMEYSRKCEVVEERAELKRENQRLRAENLAVKTLVEDAKKQQPEIPEFVAEGIKSIPDHYTAFGAMLLVKEKIEITKGGDINSDWLPLYNWLFSNNEINSQDLFSQAWLNGYTVAKEKRFYLKHELTGQFLAKRNQKSEHQKYFFWTGENPLTHSIGTAWDLKFTQQELDSMAADSYEQIEVEE